MTLALDPTPRTRLWFGILGPLSATLDGTEVGLGGRRQRGVLAALLVARGQLMSTERLLDALWDGAPPPSGPANLQSYVSHLRRALEPGRAARAQSTVLVSHGGGYALRVPDDDVDARRFERLVQTAQGEADPQRRCRLLQDALGLWRGPALGEHAGDEWAAPEARRLEELRTLARESLLGARLDTGEAAVVVPELEALLAEEPLREERWRLLALALYRAHRQGDALATLRRARETLSDELGVDPGPALRRLESELLAQSPALDAPAPPERTGGASTGSTSGAGFETGAARPPQPPGSVATGSTSGAGFETGAARPPQPPGRFATGSTSGAGSETGAARPPQPPASVATGSTSGAGFETGAARPPQPPAHGLVDRDAEVARLQDCLADTLAGRPRVAVIEGPAGIGKTSLLGEARRLAAEAGATVLTARGSQLEKEYGFGAVRQLFDPVLVEDTAQRLLAGAAAAAGRVFDATADPTAERTESLFPVLHGLYWLTANLVERGPLVLAIDDLQWCDSGSLRFLGYLARRLGGMRLLVVATIRTGEQYVDEELLAEITGEPETLSVQPAPLSRAGVTALVRTRLPGADGGFVSACYGTTGGNPLLLRQLLRALEAEGVRPDAAHADTVRAIGSRAVSSMVLRRFRRMPHEHREVARAISVLGDGASLPVVAALTGLSEADTAAGIATLARAEVLRPELPLGFVHPLVGDAVYDDIPVGERELLHERAAHVLAEAGASPERVAAHLLVVPARADLAVVHVLREAARRDTSRGAGESAIAYLRRALVEPPAAEELPAVLMELGGLEAMTHGPAAMEHLAAAYSLLDDPHLKADTAIMLARTAVFAGERGEATRIARKAAAELDPALTDQRQALLALERISAYMHGLDIDPETLGRGPEPSGDGAGAHALAAVYAWELLCSGEQRERALELARFALEGRVLQRVDPGLLWVVAGVVLALGGEDTTAFWRDELAHAYREGGLFAALGVHLWLGFVQWQDGDLRESLQSMAHCTEQNELWGANHVGQPYTDGFMVHMLLDRGDPVAAREALELARERARIGEGVRLYGEAEAAVLLAEGDPAAALAALESVQHTMTAVANPAWKAWRSRRAEVLAALGEADKAVELVTEDLALARRWGTPGLVGRTLRLLGELQGADGVETLREAVDELAASTHRLELARAKAALARALARRGRPGDEPEERAALLDALSLAETCGAEGLRRDVAAALQRCGVDVPDRAERPVPLTSAERRVAEMAVAGLPQSQIAQTLFVTCSTVQTLVESVSQRLGAQSLEELAEALDRL